MRITAHAIQRYIERVECVDFERAKAQLEAASPCVAVAARMGCDTVILGNGGRLVLDGDVIVTVLAKRMGKAPRLCDRRGEA